MFTLIKMTTFAKVVVPFAAADLPTIGSNIETQVTGFVAGAIVALILIAILKRASELNLTKILGAVVAGAIVWFTVTNWSTVAGWVTGIFKPFFEG